MSDIVNQFLNSSHGQKAKQSLVDQGYSDDEANTYLSHAAQAGADHVQKHAEKHGFLGDHPGRNFFAAYAAGVVRGDGIVDSMGDGFEGALTGRITEAICNKMGVDDNVASTVSATAAPFVATFLKEHLRGN
jgi:hypothetical protein